MFSLNKICNNALKSTFIQDSRSLKCCQQLTLWCVDKRLENVVHKLEKWLEHGVQTLLTKISHNYNRLLRKLGC
jgi:hypothetical protein